MTHLKMETKCPNHLIIGFLKKKKKKREMCVWYWSMARSLSIFRWISIFRSSHRNLNFLNCIKCEGEFPFLSEWPIEPYQLLHRLNSNSLAVLYIYIFVSYTLDDVPLKVLASKLNKFTYIAISWWLFTMCQRKTTQWNEIVYFWHLINKSRFTNRCYVCTLNILL